MSPIFSKLPLLTNEEEIYQFKRNYFIRMVLRLFTNKEIHECFRSLERITKQTHKSTVLEIRPFFHFNRPDVIVFIVIEYRSNNLIAALCVLNSDDLRIDDDDYEFGNVFAKRLNLFGSNDTVL